jgi:transcriptional regulator with XRE-family HTH domain
MSGSQVGELLREWRARRRRSQLDLALEAGVSSRHLSFVETGRSRPSAELLIALADCLDVPLRERNTMLLAAGHAPRYARRSLDDPEMQPVLSSLQRMLDAHEPYPGVVIDRAWNVLLANQAAHALTVGVPAHVLAPDLNVFRVCLHPEGLAARTINFDEWAAYLLGQLRRTIVLTGDPDLRALERELRGYPTLQTMPDSVAAGDDRQVLVPLEIAVGDTVMSLFTTLTTFGTPRDITLDELSVELFFPNDAVTAELLATGAAGTADAVSA